MSRYLPTVVLTVLCSLCLGPALQAQTEPAKFSNFAKQIPSSQTEIFALHNLAEHAESVLRNKALTHALEEGKIAEALGAIGTSVNMENTLDELEENRRYVPETAVISMTPDSYIATIDFFQFMMRLNIAEQTNRTDDFNAEELATLEEELAEIVNDFTLPEMTVWVQWPEAKTTEELYEKFKGTVAIGGMITELEFTQKENSFLLSGLVADIDQDGFLDLFLTAMGVADKDSKIASAMLDIKILLQCELIGNGMRISIGSDHSDKKTKPVVLTEIKDGPAEIAYGQWNSKKLLTAAAELEQDMARWADKDLGKLFRSNDAEDVWGSISRFTEQIKLLSAKGQLRVWAAENQVRAKVLAQGIPKAEPLTGHKLLNLVPADIESFFVSSDYNLGELLVGMVDQLEEKLATQSLKSDLRGDFQKSNMLDEFALHYYKHFGPFRRLLIDELAKIDARPLAIVMDTKGNFDSLRAELEEENEFEFKLETNNLLRIAAISTCENPEQYQKKLMEAYEKLVAGILSVNEASLPAETKLFQHGSLSNGVPIKVFSLDWISSSELLKFELDADFQIHTFIHNGHVILSSSQKLSESLVDSGKSHLKIPAPENQSSITSRGHIKGRTIGNVYSVLMKAILGNQFAEAFAEFGEIMNHLQWTTEQKGANTNSTFVLDFKD